MYVRHHEQRKKSSISSGKLDRSRARDIVWGPNGFTSPCAEIDFREGGISLVCMRAPEEMGGQDLYST